MQNKAAQCVKAIKQLADRTSRAEVMITLMLKKVSPTTAELLVSGLYKHQPRALLLEKIEEVLEEAAERAS